MKFGDAFTELLGLLIICAIVAGVLYWLARQWVVCRTETEAARKRASWPTTTVRATRFGASLKHSKRGPPGIFGHYRFELDGKEHTAEVFESSSGPREERASAIQVLRQEEKVIDLKVQFDPRDPSVVSNEIVTSLPLCRFWIGGSFLFFCAMELLVLRGLLRLILGIIRG